MLNEAQNKKLLLKLTRCLSIFDPYIFSPIVSLPFSYYTFKPHI